MSRKALSVWFLVFDGVELLDIAGPWEVLSHANDVLGYDAYTLHLKAPAGGAIATRHRISLADARPLPRRARRLPDIAVIPGGSPYALQSPEQIELVRWLKRHSELATVVSICTGAFLLGEAGLLDDRLATTHWRYLTRLQRSYPNANVVDDGIFVHDGNLWTSAGVTAGVDLTLAMLEQQHGHEVALAVAKELVLFLRRSGNQAQFSQTLQRQQKESKKLRHFSTFVLEHLHETLSVEHLAEAMGVSARSLTRWCRDQMDVSPAEFVRQVRLDEARRLLEESHLPLKTIAAETGLGDSSTLWRLFTQRLGITPAEYRERFQLD